MRDIGKVVAIDGGNTDWFIGADPDDALERVHAGMKRQQLPAR